MSRELAGAVRAEAAVPSMGPLIAQSEVYCGPSDCRHGDAGLGGDVTSGQGSVHNVRVYLLAC